MSRVPWTGARWTYEELDVEANRVARGLLAMGVQKGDRVGIMAGNCEQYISVFFGVARVGAILVVLNNTYTAAELDFALKHTGSSTLLLSVTLYSRILLDCRVLFLTPRIGRHSLEKTLEALGANPRAVGQSKALEEIIVLRGEYGLFTTYAKFIQRGTSLPSEDLLDREATLHSDDVCNLQFTSGSTENPKAAMLTHL